MGNLDGMGLIAQYGYAEGRGHMYKVFEKSSIKYKK